MTLLNGVQHIKNKSAEDRIMQARVPAYGHSFVGLLPLHIATQDDSCVAKGNSQPGVVGTVRSFLPPCVRVAPRGVFLKPFEDSYSGIEQGLKLPGIAARHQHTHDVMKLECSKLRISKLRIGARATLTIRL